MQYSIFVAQVKYAGVKTRSFASVWHRGMPQADCSLFDAYGRLEHSWRMDAGPSCILMTAVIPGASIWIR